MWVVNWGSEEFRDHWKGREIVVPPNRQKTVKMPYLEAERYLSKGYPMPDTRPDGSHEFPPKALHILEMTDEEIAMENGTTVAQVKAEKERVQSLHTCATCGDDFDSRKGLEIHVGRTHKAGTD